MGAARSPLREQRPPARGRRAAILGGVFAVAALAAGAAVGPQAAAQLERAARGGPFRLDTVSVVGARRVPARVVVAASGLQRGIPLVDVDVEAVARQVETLPQVASARALRLPPDRVVVGVEERVARGVAAGRHGVPLVVCRDGVPFARASRGEIAALPVLASGGAGEFGVAHAGLARAAALAETASATGFAVADVSVAAGDDPRGAVLRLRGLAAPVLLGHDESNTALARLVRLVSRRPDLVAGATSIDVRFADRAVLRSDEVPAGADKEAATRGRAAPSGGPSAG